MASFPVLNQETLFRNGTWSYRIPALLYLPRFSIILAFAEEREDLVDEHAKLIAMRRGIYNPITHHVQVSVWGENGGDCLPVLLPCPQISWMCLPSRCREKAASSTQKWEINLPVSNVCIIITAGIQPHSWAAVGRLKWGRSRRFSGEGFNPSLRS